MASRRITRREFVSRTAKAGLGLSALSLGLPRVSAGESEDFEFIVVGSGAGGGPLACNLARAGYRVLLLEAGSVYSGPNYDIPAFSALATEDPEMAWNFYVDHYRDPAQQARDWKYVPGKGILYPRAGTVGGCTAHNDLVTLYPENRDWDDIAALTGDPSWENGKMRSYFERLEACRYAKPGRRSRHGFKGWLPTEIASTGMVLKDPKLMDLVLSSMLGRGFLRPDPNDWSYVRHRKNGGVFSLPMSTRDGHRSGPRELILETLAAFPDRLVLKTRCLATRVLFDDVDRTRAVGVEYLEGARLYRADPRATRESAALARKCRTLASREVILCGGAFNSPQLLMLSGVGPEEKLRSLGIDVRLNLPGVGKNLQDRYEISITTPIHGEFPLLKDCKFGTTEDDPCLVAFHRAPRESPYSSNGTFLSFLRKSSKDRPDPDLCIFGIMVNFKGYFPGWSRDVYRNNYFTWAILKGHTRNTAGTVELRSSDPLETPEIHFNYFSDGNDGSGQDLEDVLAGLKFARSVNQDLLARLIEKDEDKPGAAVKSDDDLRQYIRDEAWGHHASCSNRIGPRGDPMAVLDSEFRVQGAKNLRVVDASVFPRIPGLFIAASVYMVAEKASDTILKDARA